MSTTLILCFSLVADQRDLRIIMKNDEVTSWHHCSQCNIYLQTDIQLQSHNENHHLVIENSKINEMKSYNKQIPHDRNLKPILTMTQKEIQLRADILNYISIDFDVERR